MLPAVPHQNCDSDELTGGSQAPAGRPETPSRHAKVIPGGRTRLTTPVIERIILGTWVKPEPR
jgi:hypothetical protein